MRLPPKGWRGEEDGVGDGGGKAFVFREDPGESQIFATSQLGETVQLCLGGPQQPACSLAPG